MLATRNFADAVPATRWSLVQALSGEATGRRRALEVFARDYWPAVYAFARKKGHSPHDAEDITQSFLSGLLASTTFESLSPDKGRFRSWLLACLHNYLCADWRERNRQKRGGKAVHVSIDRDLGEAWLESANAHSLTPEDLFDRRWASLILARAFEELARIYGRDGKEDLARVLLPLITGGEARPDYAAAAEQLGLSEGSARMAAFRMRKRLRGLVREQIAATVGSQADVEDELRQLFAVFSTP
jgi:RNA polymerase sigma-70 factor (ECF subfamily)